MPANYENAIIIGQDELIKKVDSYNIDTLPHSLLFEGNEGCGKHTLSYYIGKKFNLEVVELNSNEERKDVDGMQFKPYPCLYIINLVGVIPKFQNSILKILEEPPAGAFFICLCLNHHLVLPTIQNRCVLWTFKGYTTETLNRFTAGYAEADREIALRLFDTPGKLLKNVYHPIREIDSLAKDIMNRIGKASIPNVLSISDKIAYKNEKDKFDLSVVISALVAEAYDKVLHSTELKYTKAYMVVADMQESIGMCISKQRTFEGYLIKLHEVMAA